MAVRKEVEPPNKYEELESNTSEDWTADINEALERTHSADTARDTVKGIFISIIYIGLNAYLSVTNKWLFQSEGFEYPIFIIVFGQTVSFLLSLLAILVFNCSPLISAEEFKKGWKVLLLNACTQGLSIGLENISIQKTDIGLNQVIKVTASLFTMAAAYFLEGRIFTKKLIVLNILLVVGAGMTTLHNPSANVIGVVTSFASLLLGVLHILLTGYLLQQVTISPLTLTMFTTLPAAIVLVPIFFKMELVKLWTALAAGQFYFDMTIVCIGSFVAFAYTVVGLVLIKFAGPHYTAIVGNLKVAILVLLSMEIFPKPLTYLNQFGMVLTLTSFFLYNFFKYRQPAVIPGQTPEVIISASDANDIELDDLRSQ